MDLNGISEARKRSIIQVGITEACTSRDLNEAIIKACTSLNSKFEEHPKEKERSKCMIYRVHRHLRDVNCSAYEPQVISIGPYHRGKDHLKMMEDHKLHTLQFLVERKGIDIMEYAKVVGGVASKARKCYADQDFDLSESEFIEMLVLDGCFIIHLARTYAGLEKEADPIFQMEWMSWSLLRDLMLFENQVPFFVLLKLFNVIYPRLTDLAFLRHLTYLFIDLYPGSQRSAKEEKSYSSEVAQQGSQEIMHILDLFHRYWLPRDSLKPEEEKSDAHTITIERKGPESQESEEEKSYTLEFELIYCATRLTEANVKFEVKQAATCLFDIEFKDGTMVMPPLYSDDMTECLFRNLMAYEQYFKNSPHNSVTQYMWLLHNLINSSKDVEILSQNRIIRHLQIHEVVANMVNRLGDLIAYEVSKSKYAKLFKDVNEHCRKPKSRWMAKLRRDYLHSPWAILSILAAVVLLLLTVVQTVFTILQVVQ